MDNENILIRLGADITGFSRNMRAATSDLDRFQSANKETFEAFTKVGAVVSAGGIAIAAGLTVAVKQATTFDTSMRKAGAIAGATAEEFDAMKASAIKLGADTSKSAGEVAEAMTEMAAKGFSATQVISAMPGVISASEASGEALALTADTVATALNVWSMEAGQAGKVADVLAMSANVSAAGIDDLGFVLKYAGAPAAALGISLEEVAAAAGIMADAGLNGSNAGTSLRASLLALNNPAKQQEKIMKKLGFSLTDSKGEAKSLSGIVGDLAKSLEGETEAQKVATLGKLVGTEAVSGFLALMKAGPAEINKNTKALENSAGASKKAADEMMAGIGGAIEEMSGAFESAAILIGDRLVPYIQDLARKTGDLVDKFNNLSPAVQDTIVKGAALTAGLAILGGGALLLVGAIPKLIAGYTAVSTVFAATKFAVLGLSTGIGPLAAAFTFLTGPVGLAVLAIGAIAVAGVALVNHLRNDAIPEVDRFGEGVSESTQKALGGFFELSDGAGQSLAELSIASSKVTGEMATDLIGKYSEMNKQILGAMNERHAEQESSMRSFFLNSSVLSDEAEAAILQKQQNSHDLQVLSQESKEKRIKTILESASKEKRSLTQTEKDELNKIQQSMNENAVKYLSKNEVEQKVIMEKMKQSAGDLSAKQAADVVKNSAKQRNEAVKEAEGQYTDAIAQIIRMRDETGEITADQATKLIAEATRARDGAVKQAENMHGEVVKEAKAQAGEHVDSVNWETGEILSKWDVFKGKTKTKFNEIAKGISDGWQKAKEWTSEKVEAIKKAAADKFEDLKKSVSDKMTDVKKKISEKWDEVMTFFKGIDLLQTGKDIVSGLVKGIGDMFGKVKTKISELANLIPEWARDILGIHSPSRVFIEIGKYIVEGLAGGISDSKRVVIDTMSGLLGVLVATSKSNASEVLTISKKAEKDRLAVQTDFAKKRAELARKTESSAQSALKTSKNKKGQIVTTGANNVYKIRANASAKLTKLNEDEAIKLAKISEKAAADALKRSNQLSKEQLEAVKTYVADKKSLEEMSIVAESEVWRRSIDLFKVGTKERVEAQKAYQASLKVINDEITKTNEEYASKMTVINDKLRKDEQELTDKYTKTVDDRANALYSFAGTFDYFEYKLEQTGADLLANLNSQVSAFKGWQHQIDLLSAKAIDDGLIAELRAMGPKALPQLVALNSMTDKQMSEYSALYAEKSKLARTQAEKELIGMKADTEKQIKQLQAVANRELSALEREWTTKIKGITKATDDELMSLKKIGRQAAEGLKTGLESMEPALVRTATSIANAVKSAMAGAFDIHSPSRWMRDFIGVNMMAGWIDGISSMRSNVLAMSDNATSWMTPTVPKIADYQTPNNSAGVPRSLLSSPDTGSGTSGGFSPQITNHFTPAQSSPSESARKQHQMLQRMAIEYR